MSTVNRRVLIVALFSITISLVALLMSYNAYTVAQNIEAGSPTNATSITLGRIFNWKTAEVIDVQGNLYAYQGLENPSVSTVAPGFSYTLRIAKWQSTWLGLSYLFYTTFPHQNVTLSPYVLEIQEFNNNYVTATFFEGNNT